MPFRVILVIEWQHNTWTNMIVKMFILRLLGLSDDKEKKKIGAAMPEGPPLRGFRYDVWCRRKSKTSQFIGTGWTDGSKRGIGALDVLCSRDDASRARVKSSAPVFKPSQFLPLASIGLDALQYPPFWWLMTIQSRDTHDMKLKHDKQAYITRNKAHVRTCQHRAYTISK